MQILLDAGEIEFSVFRGRMIPVHEYRSDGDQKKKSDVPTGQRGLPLKAHGYCATLAGATTGAAAAAGLANFAGSIATFGCTSSRVNMDCPSVDVKRH